MASSGLKIYGARSALDEMVSSAGEYTASDSGSAAHLRYILFEAKDGVLTVTAQSNSGAIRFEPEGVTVESDGRMMVSERMLSTALSVFDASQTPVLDHDDAKNKLFITADDTETDLSTSPISNTAILPSVGEFDDAHGIEVAPEDFVSWFGQLAPFRNRQGNMPVMTGIHADMVGDHMRGVAADGRFTFATHQLPITSVGDGIESMLMEYDGINIANQFIKRGSIVRIHLNSETQRLHIIVSSKDKQMYHVCVPLLNVEAGSYPVSRLLAGIKSFGSSSKIRLSMNKNDMLQVMRNAANIGGLNPSQNDGASRYVDLLLSEDTLEVQGGTGTDASYQDTRRATVNPLDTDLAVRFAFGLFGHLIETYHNPDEPEMIKVAMSESKAGKVNSMLLYFGDNVVENDGDLPGSIMMIPVSQMD